jgi:hypothetical protein
MAFEVVRNPSILTVTDATEKLRFEFASGDVEDVTVEEVEFAYNQYRNLIEEFRDWNNGLFTISRTEYKQLPEIYIQAKRLFDSFFREK